MGQLEFQEGTVDRFLHFLGQKRHRTRKNEFLPMLQQGFNLSTFSVAENSSESRVIHLFLFFCPLFALVSHIERRALIIMGFYNK
jgi:hypothetical protein